MGMVKSKVNSALKKPAAQPVKPVVLPPLPAPPKPAKEGESLALVDKWNTQQNLEQIFLKSKAKKANQAQKGPVQESRQDTILN